MVFACKPQAIQPPILSEEPSKLQVIGPASTRLDSTSPTSSVILSKSERFESAKGFCNGVYIKTGVILTAGHCLQDKEKEAVYILFRVSNSYYQTNYQSNNFVAVKAQKLHYYVTTIDKIWDYGMIYFDEQEFLQKTSHLPKSIRPIPTPILESPLESITDVFMHGMGGTFEVYPAQELRKASFLLFPHSKRGEFFSHHVFQKLAGFFSKVQYALIMNFRYRKHHGYLLPKDLHNSEQYKYIKSTALFCYGDSGAPIYAKLPAKLQDQIYVVGILADMYGLKGAGASHAGALLDISKTEELYSKEMLYRRSKILLDFFKKHPSKQCYPHSRAMMTSYAKEWIENPLVQLR